jgi:hypothetical protein
MGLVVIGALAKRGVLPDNPLTLLEWPLIWLIDFIAGVWRALHEIHLTLFETVVIGLLLLIYAQVLRIKNR